MCWKDYPIATDSVDYQREFTNGTILPDKFMFNSESIKTGMPIAQVEKVIGISNNATETEQRTEQQQCDYLLKILSDHPNSMYLYKLAALAQEHLSGFFGSLTWDITDIGTIRAFWHAQTQAATHIVYMYSFSLNSVISSPQLNRKGLVLSRQGRPSVSWDIERNQVIISGTRH